MQEVGNGDIWIETWGLVLKDFVLFRLESVRENLGSSQRAEASSAINSFVDISAMNFIRLPSIIIF